MTHARADAHDAHDHHHAHHGPGRHHHHVPWSFDRAFAIGVRLNVGFVIAEVVYERRAHSLALTADAGHDLGNVLGLLVAWAGSLLARRGPTPRRTCELRRFSILAAMANLGFLLIAVGAQPLHVSLPDVSRLA
jgi:cobalt-zinc-cadmium efflux system protein